MRVSMSAWNDINAEEDGCRSYSQKLVWVGGDTKESQAFMVLANPKN